jgi:putative lysine transport system permease protein
VKYIFKYIKKFIVKIFKTISYLIDISIGNLLVTLFKIKEINAKKELLKKVRKLVYSLLVLIMIIYNAFFSDYIFLDYTIGYIFKLIVYLASFIKDVKIAAIFIKYSTLLWKGIKVTLHLSIIGTLIGLLIALLFSLILNIRVTKKTNRVLKIIINSSKGFVKLYVTVIRGTPMMIQAMVFFYGVYTFYKWDPLTAAIFTVSINTASYLTEILRGGINAIDKGQMEASRALGLTYTDSLLYIIYPQAIKNSMPAFGNELIINVKDTSVLSVIMVTDLYRVATIAAANTFDIFNTYLLAAILYLILTYSLTILTRFIEKKLKLKEISIPTSANYTEVSLTMPSKEI